MKLPSPVDYSDAVATPAHAFRDPVLARARMHMSARGPVVASGGFALTFEARSASGRFAVRCFHKYAEHLQDRYAAISAFIKDHPVPYLAGVDYQPHGVLVGGSVYPLVKMLWIDGERLDDWLPENVTDAAAIRRIRKSLTAAVTGLQRLNVAHGDLQHGNILVNPGGDVTLIDYDGMYLPVLASLGAGEFGHPNYQHPKRMNRYDTSLDAFPAFLIDLSLRALEFRPDLFERFGEGENILFSARDFVAPSRSPVFAQLGQIPALKAELRLLAEACTAEYPAAVAMLSNGRAQAAPATRLRQVDLIGAAAISALDSVALRARVGDEVTVIGKITHVYTGVDRFGRDYSFLNCGQPRTFTIVCWSSVHAQLSKRIAVEDLKDRWARLTGTLELYRGKPQIQLRREQQLHLETRERAAELLRPAMRPVPPAVPAPATPAHAGPSPATPLLPPLPPPPRQSASTLAEEFDAYQRAQTQPQPTQRQPQPMQPVSKWPQVPPRMPSPPRPIWPSVRQPPQRPPTPSKRTHVWVWVAIVLVAILIVVLIAVTR